MIHTSSLVSRMLHRWKPVEGTTHRHCAEEDQRGEVSEMPEPGSSGAQVFESAHLRINSGEKRSNVGAARIRPETARIRPETAHIL